MIVNEERHGVSKEFPKPLKPWVDTGIYIVKPGPGGYGVGTVTIVNIENQASGTIRPGIGGNIDIDWDDKPIGTIPKGRLQRMLIHQTKERLS